MSKRKVGPFSELEDLTLPLMENQPEGLQIALAWRIRGALASYGFLPNGTKREHIRDPDFGSDIGELIIRAQPHEITDGQGNIRVVHVKLSTLQVEVDDNNEIMAWIYEEGA